MQVIFVHHSCFVVEIDGKVLIFDWFSGDGISGQNFGGVLPEYGEDTPVYVFASHRHRDHFDMDVLHLAGRYENIHFIFSKDCRMSPHFMEKHGFSAGLRSKIVYVKPCEKYQVDGMEIETLRSTDEGVAFYVTVGGVGIFHAGDLNNWTWEGAGDLVNGMMESNFKAQIRRLLHNKIHVAFFPLDPRLGEHRFLGIEYFMEHTDADYIFPMHMWQNYDGIRELKKRISNGAMAERIMEISHENQVFLIQETERDT